MSDVGQGHEQCELLYVRVENNAFACRWILQPDVASCTTECLDLVRSEMNLLLTAESTGVLLPNEVALLARVKRDAEGLLRVSTHMGIIQFTPTQAT